MAKITIISTSKTSWCVDSLRSGCRSRTFAKQLLSKFGNSTIPQAAKIPMIATPTSLGTLFVETTISIVRGPWKRPNTAMHDKMLSMNAAFTIACPKSVFKVPEACKACKAMPAPVGTNATPMETASTNSYPISIRRPAPNTKGRNVPVPATPVATGPSDPSCRRLVCRPASKYDSTNPAWPTMAKMSGLVPHLSRRCASHACTKHVS
mmetsp:Transcript_78355/g.153829  ORF Transcript_78355/g.153829 Transcript_78355/m.153829 type:complete len:208 (-) Transcript_78355:68-691(-)